MASPLMPPEYENRAKKLFYDVMQDRVDPAKLSQQDKILLNRWLVYNLSEEERKIYGLVSPEEFDRMYPPEWLKPTTTAAPGPKEGLPAMAEEFKRGLIGALTLGLAEQPTVREHKGILDPLALARAAGGIVGTLPYFAPGLPFMRVGAAVASKLPWGPIARIVTREGVAAGLHSLARALGIQVKESGVSGIRPLDAAVTAAVEGALGAVGARILVPRMAAGDIARSIANRIQAHAAAFADSPAAKAGEIKPLEEAVNVVARELNELAQAIRSQKTTTSQEIRTKFQELLGIKDPQKNIFFASPEHAAQFLEHMASKGVQAIPRAIRPTAEAGFLRRPAYAEQVAEALRKAKEAPTTPPPAQPRPVKPMPVSPEEALTAALGEKPPKKPPARPTKAKARPTPMPELETVEGQATTTGYVVPEEAPLEELLKALTTPTAPARRVPRKQPQQTLEQLLTFLQEPVEKKGKPPTQRQPHQPKQSGPVAQPRRAVLATPQIDTTNKNIMVDVDATPETSNEEVIRRGSEVLRNLIGEETERLWSKGASAKNIKIKEILDDGTATIVLPSGREVRQQVVRVKITEGGRKYATIDARLNIPAVQLRHRDYALRLAVGENVEQPITINTGDKGPKRVTTYLATNELVLFKPAGEGANAEGHMRAIPATVKQIAIKGIRNPEIIVVLETVEGPIEVSFSPKSYNTLKAIMRDSSVPAIYKMDEAGSPVTVWTPAKIRVVAPKKTPAARRSQ